jgi:hypothetical protein
MKQIILTLCVVFVFITSANAGEMYSCIDRNGNAIVTDSPQDGMTNCVLKDSYRDPTPEERAQWQREKEERERSDKMAEIIKMQQENERQKAIQDARNREKAIQGAARKQQDAERKQQDAEWQQQDAESRLQDAESRLQEAEWKQRSAESRLQEAEWKQRSAETKKLQENIMRGY